mmetsp:Transcript_4933/g.7530  ORF Transcript_4933/g.7530 Transcript_4933/m.7530 type:complete len:476 (+) Transcript_4933:100-1527(+)
MQGLTVVYLAICAVLCSVDVEASVFPKWNMTPRTHNSQNIVSESRMTSNHSKIGVLLLNLGGPEKEEDVRGFLYNLFADPDIIRLPKILSFLQKPIAYFIARNRAPKSAAAYKSIGGGSPINMYTAAQANGVMQELDRRGIKNATCYVGMRYWQPYTEQALERIKQDGVTTLVVLPLYPHYSISTTGSSLGVLKQAFDKEPGVWGAHKLRHTVIPYWYSRPGYVSAMAALIAERYRRFTPEQRSEGVTVLFSAHGVPVSYIDAGDPYKDHIERCATLVSEKLGSILRAEATEGGLSIKLPGDTGEFEEGCDWRVRCRLSFQSRVGPVEWLRPYTDDTLRELGAEGVRNLIVVPVSFVSEHIETLEEIDMEYREVAEEAGIVNWQRAPALNTDEAFIKEMADMVEEAMKAPDITVDDVLRTATTSPTSGSKSGMSSRAIATALVTGAAGVIAVGYAMRSQGALGTTAEPPNANTKQ